MTLNAQDQIKKMLQLFESTNTDAVKNVNPFDEGFDAAREGESKALCPYRKDSAEFKAWMEGFAKGKDEVADKKEISESASQKSDLEKILNRFKFEVKQFQDSGEMDDPLYDALYDYYSESGEMPYGVMKARTGDPYQWVSNKFGQDLTYLLAKTEYQTMTETESLEPHPTYGMLTEENEEQVRSIFNNLGFEEGLDYFFDDDLIVIGRDTARVVINALKANPKFDYIPYIVGINNEEVTIGFDQITECNESKNINESVSVVITGSGDEVVNDLCRLSGIHSLGGMQGTNQIDQCCLPPTNPIKGFLGILDQFSKPSEIEVGVKEGNKEDNRGLSNSPNEKVMGVNSVTNPPADDLNRPKKMNHQGGLTGGDNPLTEAVGHILTLHVIENAKLDPRSSSGTADGYYYDENDNEIVVTLEFDYALAERANTDADSQTPGPGHDTEVTLTRVFDKNGIDVPLEDIHYDEDSLIDAVEQAAKDRIYGESKIQEGAKVDCIVKHIINSEIKAGKIKEEAEKIVRATVNKREMLEGEMSDFPDMMPIEGDGAFADDVNALKELAGLCEKDTPKFRTNNQVRLEKYGVSGSGSANAFAPIEIEIDGDVFFVSKEELDIVLGNPGLNVRIIEKHAF